METSRAIRFLVDYRGVLTNELYYRAGEVLTVTADQGAALVAAGRAEYIADISQVGPWDKMTLAELRDAAKDAGLDHYWLKGRDTLLAELEKQDE